MTGYPGILVSCYMYLYIYILVYILMLVKQQRTDG